MIRVNKDSLVTNWVLGGVSGEAGVEWAGQRLEIQIRHVGPDHNAEEVAAWEVGKEPHGETDGGHGHHAAVELVLDHVPGVLEELVPWRVAKPVPGGGFQ